MTGADVDLRRLGAAALLAAGTGYGAAVALREDVPGEPLGIRPPWRVPTQLALAWGAGTSAPWPMAVAALGLALRRGRPAGTATVALGAALLFGQLVEPVAWGRRPSPPAVTRAVALNLAAGVGLVLAGRART